jgi:hypothetical protein
MKRILGSTFAFALMLSPELASAKLSCYPLAQIEQALGAEYGETRRFAGQESTGIEYRLYVNAKTGTWSWIGIPAGAKVGCLIFAGRGEVVPPSAEPSTTKSPPDAQF